MVSCEQLASFGRQSYAVRIRVIGRWQKLQTIHGKNVWCVQHRTTRSNCFHFRSPLSSSDSSSPFLSRGCGRASLSLSMQIFTPERGIKRGSERMASFNIGNSCSITLFHRGFALARHHQWGRLRSACISVFPRRLLLTLRA